MSFLFQENFTTGSLVLDLSDLSRPPATLQLQLQADLNQPQAASQSKTATARRNSRQLSVPRKPVGTGTSPKIVQEANQLENNRPKPRRKPVAEPNRRFSVNRVPLPIYHTEHEIDEAYKEYVVSPSQSDHEIKDSST